MQNAFFIQFDVVQDFLKIYLFIFGSLINKLAIMRLAVCGIVSGMRSVICRSFCNFCNCVGCLQLYTRRLSCFFRMATELANKKAEREALRGVIQQWNANRLDLFELSEPNEVSAVDDTNFLSLVQNCCSHMLIRTKCILSFSTGLGVSWRNEVLFPRQRPKSCYQVHQGRLGRDQPGGDRNAYRKISSRHENAIRPRIRSLRDSRERRRA